MHPILDWHIHAARMVTPSLGITLVDPHLSLAIDFVAFNLLAFSQVELYMCKQFGKHYVLLVN